MRAQRYVVLPEEDADEFVELEATLVAELAPVGALQTVLARRVAVAAWRLARADRIEVELFAERHIAGGGVGLALIRDGNGTRSLETLLRYRGAALRLDYLMPEPPTAGCILHEARASWRSGVANISSGALVDREASRAIEHYENI